MATSPASRTLPRDGMWVILRALNEVLGDNDYAAVIVRAGLPPAFTTLGNRGRDWPEATHRTAGSVTRAVFDIYGDRARELLLASGKAEFRHAMENLPTFVSMLTGMMKVLPADVRMKMALEQGIRDLRRSSGALPVLQSDAGNFLVIDPASPVCAGQTATFPLCWSRVGIMIALLEWALEGTVTGVAETACRAMGAAECRFVAPKSF